MLECKVDLRPWEQKCAQGAPPRMWERVPLRRSPESMHKVDPVQPRTSIPRSQLKIIIIDELE